MNTFTQKGKEEYYESLRKMQERQERMIELETSNFFKTSLEKIFAEAGIEWTEIDPPVDELIKLMKGLSHQRDYYVSLLDQVFEAAGIGFEDWSRTELDLATELVYKALKKTRKKNAKKPRKVMWVKSGSGLEDYNWVTVHMQKPITLREGDVVKPRKCNVGWTEHVPSDLYFTGYKFNCQGVVISYCLLKMV